MLKNFINYLVAEKRFSDHTVKSYVTDLKQFFNFLKNEFEIKNHIEEVQFQLVRAWIASMLEQGLSPRSVNRKISTLRTYYKFLIREGKMSKNPMLRVVAPKLSKRLPAFIEEDQIEHLLDNVQFEEGFIGDRNKLIIELFYVTGIRLSELINLKKNDIDLYNQSIKILGKRNKERLIPLSPNIIKDLKKFISNNMVTNFLFTNIDGNKLYPRLVYRIVHRYIGKISSVSKKSPHILRHTFATHMLNNGADINAIKDLLGHTNLSATQVYTHNSIEKLKKVYKQAHPRA